MKLLKSQNINLITILLVIIYCIAGSCDVNELNTEKIEKQLSYPSENNREGFLLANQYCGTCHQYVAPEILPKEYWKTVLTKMSRNMGFNREGDPYYGHTSIALSRLDSARVFPTQQIISNEDWQKLVLFYLNSSNDSIDLGIRPHIDFSLEQFMVKPIPWRTPLQGPTFVEILDNRNIAVGFSMLEDKNQIYVIDVHGNVRLQRQIPASLTSISESNNELYMSFMGLFEADDTPTGMIGKVKVDNDLYFTDSIEYVLVNRERSVHVNAVDLNNDNRTDLIVSEFGKFLGGLYIYILNKSGEYEKKILYGGPGATLTIIRDVNNDGLPDIYALISQGNEGIYLFTNNGGFQFESKKLLEFPPYYGSVYMELVDFDQDGLEDIIFSNGDSGDFGNPEKPFHGIRFFKNMKNQLFQEKWFYPQQGAYKTIVLDFDQDGDLDIASIGFFAYGTSFAEEGFLYLENLGQVNGEAQFKTYSFAGAAESSYLVMDAGDIDGDGDQDLILGASSTLMSVGDMVDQLLKWENTGGAVVLLENTLYSR